MAEWVSPAPTWALFAVPVVLIDDPQRDLTAVDLVGERFVVRVRVAARVGLDRLQPAEGSLFPIGAGDGGDDGLEVRLAACETDPTAPLGVGQLHGGRGQVAGSEQRGVVHHDAHPSRDAHPPPVRCVEAGRRVGQGGGFDRREKALGSQILQRRRVLRIEDVGRRVRAFRHDLVGQDILVIGAQTHADAGGALEGRHQGLGRLDVLAAVHGQGVPRRGAALRAAGDEPRHQEGGRRRSQPAGSGARPPSTAASHCISSRQDVQKLGFPNFRGPSHRGQGGPEVGGGPPGTRSARPSRGLDGSA